MLQWPIDAYLWPRRMCLRLAHCPSSAALLTPVAAILSASAPPVCGLTPLLASPLPVWIAVDNFIYLLILLLMDGCLVPFLFCVDLQLSVASPPTPAPDLEPAPPPLTDWCGSLLPRLLTCGPAFWLARAAVSCAWSNHVAPPIVKSHGSVKRQGPLSTHPPAPPSQSHILEQKQI